MTSAERKQQVKNIRNTVNRLSDSADDVVKLLQEISGDPSSELEFMEQLGMRVASSVSLAGRMLAICSSELKRKYENKERSE